MMTSEDLVARVVMTDAIAFALVLGALPLARINDDDDDDDVDAAVPLPFPLPAPVILSGASVALALPGALAVLSRSNRARAVSGLILVI